MISENNDAADHRGDLPADYDPESQLAVSTR